MMQLLDLNGKWMLTQVGGAVSLKATVPGDVMTELVRAKKVSDPYYRENEKQVQWVGEADWDYAREFKVPAGMLVEERLLLQCDGLDTFADVEINGTALSRDPRYRRAGAGRAAAIDGNACDINHAADHHLPLDGVRRTGGQPARGCPESEPGGQPRRIVLDKQLRLK